MEKLYRYGFYCNKTMQHFTVKKKKKWFDGNEVNILKWLAQYPDIRPRVNLLRNVKSKVEKEGIKIFKYLKK